MKFSVTNRKQLVKIQFAFQFIVSSFFFRPYSPQAKSFLTTVSPQKSTPADSPCPSATHIATCCVLMKTLKLWLQSLLSLYDNDINTKQELKAGLQQRNHQWIGLSKSLSGVKEVLQFYDQVKIWFCRNFWLHRKDNRKWNFLKCYIGSLFESFLRKHHDKSTKIPNSHPWGWRIVTTNNCYKKKSFNSTAIIWVMGAWTCSY